MNPLADRLATTSNLRGLTEEQISIIIEVLTQMVFADGEFHIMERAGFRNQLLRLPWLAEKQTLADRAFQAAIEQAKENPEGGFQALSLKSADLLPQLEHRQELLEMAQSLAVSDGQLHPREAKLLESLKEALGLG